MSKKEVSKKKEVKLNIYQRLHAVMKDVEYIRKEDKKVNNQYTFVSHDAVTGKCRKAFVDHGVLVVPTVQQNVQNGNRTETTILVEFVNIDNPDDKVLTTSIGYGIDNQDKGVGKAYSYAYKNALLKVLALETGDDPERDSIEHDGKDNYHEDAWQDYCIQVKDAILLINSKKDLNDYWESQQVHIEKMERYYPQFSTRLSAICEERLDELCNKDES